MQRLVVICGLAGARPLTRASSSSSRATSSDSSDFDVVIVGGGIVGCATARRLLAERPRLRVALIEKESQIGFHQTGHNSGVLHAGIYYQPGSLKARLCIEGIDLAYAYFDERDIPHRRCGKLIVAADAREVQPLEALYARALENRCKSVELVDADAIRQIQPHCRGVKAIWSPYTGIVDWQVVAEHYARDFRRAGGHIALDCRLEDIRESASATHPIQLVCGNSKRPLTAAYMIACAGLQSDRVAQLTGCSSVSPKIVPFRGEYLYLRPEKHHLVTTNIYPVPARRAYYDSLLRSSIRVNGMLSLDPRFPFLGVHFTPTMRNEVLLGPNAVLAFSREGYTYGDISARDLWDVLAYRGMRRLMMRYARFGLSEIYGSAFVGAQVRRLQRYVPELERADVTRGRSGVRAQALDESGALVDDFVFDSGEGPLAPRALHVRNAPSPGATSSLAIAKLVVEKALAKFDI